ncbi:dynamin family protein [Paraburkholderia sp. B3]|uniref:dynamin family protein n=1 Tax=Paraburkholderia sp. B3 TaxID=3134791 RepID=UPI0039824529
MFRERSGNAFPPEYARRTGEAFARVEACLSDALHDLDPVTQTARFGARIADGLPVQHQMVYGQLGQIREAMQTIADRHQIPIPARTVSAIESCRLHVSEAMLAISGLDPRAEAEATAQPDNALPAELAEDACRLVDHLMTLLDALLTSLASEVNQAPAIDGSLQPSPSLRTPVIVELESIATTHGLGDLRRRAAEFARHNDISDTVVGVFGTVNAGKSTLINTLIGSALLPVSALPTTAVPVEIRHGCIERGTAMFVAARPEWFDRARVAEFVDAHQNADNARGVTRIVLETPSPFLANGVTLIDTPGIAWSMTDADGHDLRGAPWCDIAIVLIPATGPLTLREAAWVRELCGRGAQVTVLVTKIDLIERDERWRIYDHVVRGIWKGTGLEVPVYLLTMREDDPPWCRAWIDGPLADALTQCREQRAAMRQRQLATLRRDVLDALQIRLPRRPVEKLDPERIGTAIQTLAQYRDSIVALARKTEDPAVLLRTTMSRLATDIAHNAAALWTETRDSSFDSTRLVELGADARAHAYAAAARRAVEACRAEATIALYRTAEALGSARLGSGLPIAVDPPAFGLHAPLPTLLIPRSSGWLFGRWGFYLSTRRNLARAASMTIVAHAMLAHMEQVQTWKQHALDALAQALTADIGQIQAAQSGSGLPACESVERLRADIARLRAVAPG